MNSLRNTAIKLADRPYMRLVFLDETTDGEPIYIALTPELKGCISQGDTVEAAVNNLDDARIDYIESMLEDNLTIPEPRLAENPIVVLDLAGYLTCEAPEDKDDE